LLHPGRRFELGLPGNESTILTIDVPKNWVPSCRAGRRRGPLPTLDGSDQNMWHIEADSGRIDLHLDDPGPGRSIVEPTAWLAGSTEIDLGRTAGRARGLVNWKTDWRVELDPRNPRALEIELDRGLELLDVQGPAVQGYRTSRSGPATRLVVSFDSNLRSPTDLRFLAHAHAPSEGAWSIPGLRILNGTWTGGTSRVFLDEFHVLKECREAAGRRVFPASGDSGPLDRLEFQLESPRSAA
jgi:hypothetical protein